MATIENSPLHHDLDDEFMSDEITSTPFQTRAGSPSRGEIMPHTVAQATKFMSDLHAIVETDTESNTADVGSNASIASEYDEKIPESDDGVPVPAAPVSAPKTHWFGLTNTRICLIWVCLVLLMSPYVFFKHHDKYPWAGVIVLGGGSSILGTVLFAGACDQVIEETDFERKCAEEREAEMV